MLIWLKYFVLISLSSLLAACVTFSDHMTLVSNSIAAAENDDNGSVQSCEVAAESHDTDDNSALDPDNIAFLNWNIYKGNGENWQKDLSSYARSHDVMTIQEALLNDELAGLLKNYNFDWVMNAAFQLNDSAAGVMTVANASVVHSCGFKINEPLIRVPKSTLVSYYAIKGSAEKLLVANIHGINFTFGVEVYNAQLEQLYSAIKHHKGPMIVAGDFNTWSDDRMEQVEQLVTRLSLSDIEYPVNNKTHFFGNALDHVFYRQLERVSDQVWQVSSSDHNPISVNFRFRSAAINTTIEAAL